MKNYFSLLVILGSFMGTAVATNDLLDFRKKTEASVRENWLVVVGLEWLKPGENTIGSDAKADVNLPATAPALLGKVIVKGTHVELLVRETKNLRIDDKPASAHKSYVLTSDKNGTPTVLTLGHLKMHLIERKKGLAFRIKDSESAALKAFSGLQWWEYKKDYVFEGQWKPFTKAKTLHMPDVTGEVNEETVEGVVELEIQGQTVQLYPLKKDNQLFFVFKDLTSGKSSYGPGRFLSAELEKSGKVVMDFNRAHNPPCAYIAFATCPLPPVENHLKVSIEAGEKSPIKGRH